MWLRNNFSTISSQFLDTFTVLFLLCSFGVIEWKLFGILLLNGFLYKLLVALLDTPILYFFVYWFRKQFDLKVGEHFARSLTMGKMLRLLVKAEIISRNESGLIKECIAVRNRAVHDLAEPSQKDAVHMLEHVETFIRKYIESPEPGV